MEIGYIKGDVEYEDSGYYFTIERISYYYHENNERCFLGYIDKYGVYDKGSKLIKECPLVSSENAINMGLSSSILQYPFDPVIAIKRKEGIMNSDPYAIIRIDFVENSLIAKDISY
jgi:hypothetical protein